MFNVDTFQEYLAVGSFHEVHRFDASTVTYPDSKNVSLQSLTPNTEYAVRVVIVDVDGQAQRDRAAAVIYRTACGRESVNIL